LALLGAQLQQQHPRSISAAPRSTKMTAIPIAMSNGHIHPITIVVMLSFRFALFCCCKRLNSLSLFGLRLDS
jgi:hypothetical protein